MKRILGIDFGMVRIGLALSDPLGVTATGLETLRWNGEDNAWALQRIDELCKLHGVSEIVIGLPKRTDNKPGESEFKARAFAEAVGEVTALPVVMRDERLTTVMAHQFLQAGKVKAKQRRDVVDQVAAEIILQDYLEEKRRKR